jgi:hypothetical protein
MADEVRFLRGPESRLPQLDIGEPAITIDTEKLFFGTPSGNVELPKKSDVNGVSQRVETLETDIVAKAPVTKVRGLINIAEYQAVGDGITSDQTPITNAITEAFNNGYALNWGWDGKTYLVTDTIPNFHKVKHFGNAIIKRGTDLFYLSPTGTQRNKLYAATTGASNTFDGLTPDKPVARLQVAFDWMANYGPILTGFWEVIMKAGTFANRATLKAGLRSENPIEITGEAVGGHPNIPTTIISEGVGAGAVGIFASNGSKIKVSNVKFIGFNGTSSSAGIKVANNSELETSNCHFDSCYWGISGEGRSKVVAPDGIYNNCGYLNVGGGTGAGARSLQLTNHAYGIQNAGNNTLTALFQNCYQALLLQESSTGHVDWCTVQDCNSGVVVRVNSRANIDGTSFKRNGVDLRSEANGHVFISGNVQFGMGADESDNKVMTGSGGNLTSTSVISGVELQYSTSPKILTVAAPNQTINATTLTNIYTATLKTPLWRNVPTITSPMKRLSFKVIGRLNGTTSNKRINVRLGGIEAAIVFSAAETGVFEAEGTVFFTGKAAQLLMIKGLRNGSTETKLSQASSTLVLTTDTDFTLNGYVDNAADSIVIDLYEVGWSG